jgi:hypothetical protein
MSSKEPELPETPREFSSYSCFLPVVLKIAFSATWRIPAPGDESPLQTLSEKYRPPCGDVIIPLRADRGEDFARAEPSAYTFFIYSIDSIEIVK